jgi:pimeloyl-ACP methyl ester carboxylesterase
MQVRVVGDVTLDVLDPTPGPGRPLLLVHGFGGAKEDFADHLEALAPGRRVIVPDLRGHGSSAKPEDPAAYSLDIMAEDMFGLADALGIGTFDVVGHSMGGMIARRMVLADPDRVASVVFMDTCPGPLPGYDEQTAALGAEIARNAGLAEIKRIMDALDVYSDGPAQRVLAERPGYREFCDAKFEQLSAVMWATMFTELVGQPDQTDLLAGLSVPTLVMVGEADAPFREPADAIAAAVPGATLAVIPDAAHAPQFENPDAWFAALDAFLRVHAPTDG